MPKIVVNTDSIKYETNNNKYSIRFLKNFLPNKSFNEKKYAFKGFFSLKNITGD